MDGLPGLICQLRRLLAERKFGHHRCRRQQFFDLFNAKVVGSGNHRDEYYSRSLLQRVDGVCNPEWKAAMMNKSDYPKFFLDWLPRTDLRVGEYFPAQEFSIQRSGAS